MNVTVPEPTATTWFLICHCGQRFTRIRIDAYTVYAWHYRTEHGDR